MKKLISFVLLLATLLSLAACAGDTAGDGAPEGMQLVERGDGYTFFAPEEWVVDRSTGIPTAYVSAVDPTSITLTRVVDARTPAEYFAASEARLAATFADYTPLAEYTDDASLLGGRTASVRAFTGKLLGTAYTVKQVIARGGEHLYLLTYTAKGAPSDDDTAFRRHEEDADAAFAAFLFAGSAELTGAPEATPPVTNEGGMVLVSDPAVSRYSLYAPAGWTPDLQNGTTSLVTEGAFLSLSYEIPEEDTLLSYWDARSEAYKTLYPGYTLLTDECVPPAAAESAEDVKVWLGGRQAALYVFTFRQGGVEYKTEKRLTVMGVYVYTLTYTARTTPLADGTVPFTARYADYLAVANAFTFD